MKSAAWWIASVGVGFLLGALFIVGILGPDAVPTTLAGLAAGLRAVTPDAVVAALVALVGVSVGAFLTDHYSGRRAAATERALRAQDFERRRRDDDLDILDQTRRSVNANLNRMVAQVGGDTTGAGSIPVGTHVYPRSDPNLIDDVQLVRDYAVTAGNLMRRQPGSLGPEDLDRTSAIQVRLKVVFDRQQQRVQTGQGLTRVDPDIVANDPVLATVYAGLVGSPSSDS